MKSIDTMHMRGLRAACVIAALALCWGMGTTARAGLDETGLDSVTPIWIEISGTVSVTETDISHLFLLYSSGYSSWQTPFQAIELGEFEAGEEKTFSVKGPAVFYGNISIFLVGLYGDLDGGSYVEGTNGVCMSVNYNPDSIYSDDWYDFITPSEAAVFDYLLEGDPQAIAANVFPDKEFYYWWGSLPILTNFYNFSEPVYNGTVVVSSVIVPEPLTLLLLGAGGIALRRRNRGA